MQQVQFPDRLPAVCLFGWFVSFQDSDGYVSWVLVAIPYAASCPRFICATVGIGWVEFWPLASLGVWQRGLRGKEVTVGLLGGYQFRGWSVPPFKGFCLSADPMLSFRLSALSFLFFMFVFYFYLGVFCLWYLVSFGTMCLGGQWRACSHPLQNWLSVMQGGCLLFASITEMCVVRVGYGFLFTSIAGSCADCHIPSGISWEWFVFLQ